MMQNWDERAMNSTYYRGEYFYTITPLPLYYKRRTLLVEHLGRYVKESSSVLDFGCGDGWYIHYFIKQYQDASNLNIEGLDVSSEMVKRAQLNNAGTTIYQSDHGIHATDRYSLVYAIAVFAHVNNDSLNALFNGIYNSIHENGRFVLFEQVAKTRYEGDTFIRREISEYIDLLKSAGFSIEETKLFDFPAHRFFERHIMKYYYTYFCKGNTNFERRLHANRSLLFRFISRVFVSFDRHPVVDADSGFGNVFIVAKKV
jgi:cyclopropane fatty-acyl-phospholipid synthase-like methyltransferase